MSLNLMLNIPCIPSLLSMVAVALRLRHNDFSVSISWQTLSSEILQFTGYEVSAVRLSPADGPGQQGSQRQGEDPVGEPGNNKGV